MKPGFIAVPRFIARRWREKQTELLIFLYLKGLPTKAISQRLSRSSRAIRSKLSALRKAPPVSSGMSKKLPPWLIPVKFDGTLEEAAFVLEQWEAAASEALENVRVELHSENEDAVDAAILKIQKAGWEQTGFSCLALEMIRRGILVSDRTLATKSVVRALGSVNFPPELNHVLLELKEAADPRIAWCVWLVHGKPEEYDFYDWRCVHTRLTLQNGLIPMEAPTGKIVQEEAPEGESFEDKVLRLTRKCTPGQRPAFRALAALAEVRSMGIKTFVELRYNPLVIGLSGSGKTHVCGLFAELTGLPYLETTVAGWHLRNGRGEGESTITKILRLLDEGPCVVNVDEIEKVRRNQDNNNYFGAIVDEILALLDGRIEMFGGTPQMAENLKKSWIISAGAFQDLYIKKLGGRPMTAEEIEILEPLEYEEIVRAEWLPDELLNRISSEVIEIRPPTLEEQMRLMQAVEERLGVEMPPEKREEAARKSLTRMQAMRGLQNHALLAAKARVLMNKDEDKNRGTI